MLISKRLLVALAGCALIAAACTQETATAPPASTDVTAEALPEAWMSEEGTLTLVKTRDYTIACYLKVALKGLYDSPTSTNDEYQLMAGTTSIGYIPGSEIVRGTWRGQFYFVKTLKVEQISLRWWNGGLVQGSYAIGLMDPLYLFDTDFKLANRCP